jgi:hypothetical protein
MNLKSEKEIRDLLKGIKQNRKTGLPYSELKDIACNGTKKALEWVLEETDTPLTY